MGRAIFGALAAVTACTASAGAFDDTYWPEPKPLTTLSIGTRPIEILAVTQRARADTEFRRDHLEESQAMSKILPGYPQPAFVSFDIRVSF